jgi:membrane protein implicated in regulation of membrane protease activity
MEAKKTDKQNALRNRPALPNADAATTQTPLPNAPNKLRSKGGSIAPIIYRRALELTFFLIKLLLKYLISRFNLSFKGGVCMHAGLAFVTGVLATIAAFLFLAAISGTTYYGLAISVELTLGVTLLIVAVIVAVIFYVGVKAQFKSVKTGKEALIGAKGNATSDLKPKGEVRVMGEFWEATAKNGEVATGQAIEVIGVDGIFLVVQPVEQKA